MRKFVTEPSTWLYALVILVSAILGGSLVVRADSPISTPEVKAPVVYEGALLITTAQWHGSGVHLGDGFVLTAGHVSENAVGMVATTDDGKTFKAEVLWYNHAYDVSLVYVADLANRRGATLSCGSTSVGQSITLVGNPLNTKFAQTWGRVAGKNTTGYEGIDDRGLWRVLVTLDITAAPGVSGGPVYDEATGNVVGILVAGAIGQRGTFAYSYMVPGDTICHVMGRTV